MIIDLSSERVPVAPKVKMSAGKPVLFRQGDVRGVEIHQTACYFDDGTRSNEWLARRVMRTAYHVVVMRSGLVIVAAPLEWVMNHGNSPNVFAWGLAVEGKYQGEPGKPRKVDERELTDEARDGIWEAFKYLSNRATELGHFDFQYLWAHRQASAMRRGDPGWEIWECAEKASWERAELVPQRERVWRDGRPIPDCWARTSHPY